MELLQTKKTFKNRGGKDVTYDAYYVDVYGRKVELKAVKVSDKSLLKVGFENGK